MNKNKIAKGFVWGLVATVPGWTPLQETTGSDSKRKVADYAKLN